MVGKPASKETTFKDSAEQESYRSRVVKAPVRTSSRSSRKRIYKVSRVLAVKFLLKQDMGCSDYEQKGLSIFLKKKLW